MLAVLRGENMSEKIARIIVYTAVTASVLLGLILTVAGGTTEGWHGVLLELIGQGIFIFLLYLYNKKYK